MNISISNIEDYAERSIRLAYAHVADAVKDVPYLEEVMEEMPMHIKQELWIDIKTKGRMDTFGVHSDTEFRILAEMGKFDDYFPDANFVEEYMRASQFSFINVNKMEYNQMSIKEVW